MNPLWWFQNDDDPRPPDWYRVGQPEWVRTLGWYARNPLHNFTHYVIGFHDQETKFVTSKSNIHDKAFADEGGWMTGWLYTERSGAFPFVSWRGEKREFYIGWTAAGKLGFAWRNR